MKNDLKNSIDYLNNKTNKNSGFSVPNNYFDDVEATLFSEISTSSFPEKSGFTTPNNYFDTLENNIFNKITEDKKQSKVINFKKSILQIAPFVAAASIVLFITFNTFLTSKTTQFSLDSVTNNDIEIWMEYNSFTNNDIATVLEDDLLKLNDFSLANIKTENLEAYISTINTEELLNTIE